jgi:hypothetical protein
LSEQENSLKLRMWEVFVSRTLFSKIEYNGASIVFFLGKGGLCEIVLIFDNLNFSEAELFPMNFRAHKELFFMRYRVARFIGTGFS